MANEATLMIETEMAIPFTVADGTGFGKGTFLKLADPMTASAHDGDEDYVAGIAKTEKIANDGKTNLAVWRKGIFKVTASGSITAGQTVALGAIANSVKVSDATCVSSKTLGIALETASEGQTFLMELNPGVGANAFS